MTHFAFRKAFSCSVFYVHFVFFLLSLCNGSRRDAIFGVYCCKKLIELRKERNWLTVVGLGLSVLASTLPGSALTPVSLTIWPRILVSCFRNSHFFLFNVTPYSALTIHYSKGSFIVFFGCSSMNGDVIL